LLVEDKIVGDEISMIGFTDGKTVKLLQASQDHKQLSEGDKGPNTGGMGAYSPIVGLNEELIRKIDEMIVTPTLTGIRTENMDYKGVLYFGIMVKEGIPYLLEYNVRFGDPETEVLLPALKTDLAVIVQACLTGELDKTDLEFEDGFFADVVLASGGYPKSYEKGYEINGLDQVSPDTMVFHAGTKKADGKIVTNGGRVLNVVCKGKTLDEALENTYNEISKIHFKDMYFRRDIGKRINKYLS
jgi:phosphoribosylamine--glycine ligase